MGGPTWTAPGLSRQEYRAWRGIGSPAREALDTRPPTAHATSACDRGRRPSDRGEDPIAAWREIVALVHARLAGRSHTDLDRRPDDGSMTLRETVHQSAEANVVAASIVIAPHRS